MTWQPIETAPRDGGGILLTDGRTVCFAWYGGNDPYPWFLVDNEDHETDEQGVDRVQLNSAMEVWPTHWQPMPDPPIRT